MPITTLSPLEIREQFAAPCYLSRVRTGFPSPADDYMDKKLDLNEFLMKHPASTFSPCLNLLLLDGGEIHGGRRHL